MKNMKNELIKDSDIDRMFDYIIDYGEDNDISFSEMRNIDIEKIVPFNKFYDSILTIGKTNFSKLARENVESLERKDFSKIKLTKENFHIYQKLLSDDDSRKFLEDYINKSKKENKQHYPSK